jgi:hypothetical protein
METSKEVLINVEQESIGEKKTNCCLMCKGKNNSTCSKQRFHKQEPDNSKPLRELNGESAGFLSQLPLPGASSI